MKTLKDFRDDIRDWLFLNANDLYHSDDLLNKAVKRAYDFIGNLYLYNNLQKVQYRTADATEEGKNYFDYPTYWIQDSIFKVKINDKVLDKKINFVRFEKDKDDSTFSEWRNKIHLPFTLKEGDKIEIYGYQTAWWVNAATGEDTYSPTDNDYSIFTALNEAILLYAQAIILKRDQGEYYALGERQEQEALDKAALVYDKNARNVYTGNAKIGI